MTEKEIGCGLGENFIVRSGSFIAEGFLFLFIQLLLQWVLKSESQRIIRKQILSE